MLKFVKQIENSLSRTLQWKYRITIWKTKLSQTCFDVHVYMNIRGIWIEFLLYQHKHLRALPYHLYQLKDVIKTTNKNCKGFYETFCLSNFLARVCWSAHFGGLYFVHWKCRPAAIAFCSTNIFWHDALERLMAHAKKCVYCIYCICIYKTMCHIKYWTKINISILHNHSLSLSCISIHYHSSLTNQTEKNLESHILWTQLVTASCQISTRIPSFDLTWVEAKSWVGSGWSI